MMFTPPKLMVSAVFAKLKDIASMTGSAVSRWLTALAVRNSPPWIWAVDICIVKLCTAVEQSS